MCDLHYTKKHLKNLETPKAYAQHFAIVHELISELFWGIVELPLVGISL